jgi:hypothetical protein
MPYDEVPVSFAPENHLGTRMPSITHAPPPTIAAWREGVDPAFSLSDIKIVVDWNIPSDEYESKLHKSLVRTSLPLALCGVARVGHKTLM